MLSRAKKLGYLRLIPGLWQNDTWELVNEQFVPLKEVAYHATVKSVDSIENH